MPAVLRRTLPRPPKTVPRIYVVQGQMLGTKPLDQAVYPPTGPLKDRLFRNDLVVQEDGKRVLHFTDVTEQSRIDIQSYGMGVATGGAIATGTLGCRSAFRG